MFAIFVMVHCPMLWAASRGLVSAERNPCRGIERYKETKRERFLSMDELSRLGEVLREAEKSQMASPYAIAAIRLLLLTGARLSEILTLRWEHVDVERRLARLPRSKTGPKSIYLPAAALEILNGIPRLEGNPYVIAGEVSGEHLVNLQKPWRRVRAAAGLEDVRLHDLRHSYASVGATRSYSLVSCWGTRSHQPRSATRTLLTIP
jgi:integrase